MDDIAWRPDEAFIRATNWHRFFQAARVADCAALEAKLREDRDWFWNLVVDFFDIRFFTPYTQVLDLSAGLPHPRWCVGGTTNFALNALDRHDASTRTRTAVIWEAETGETRSWTFAELDAETCRLAAGLSELGLKAGEVVGIYLPMLPESQPAFLALAKLGCIALPLFSGFGAEAVATRLHDAGAVALITADGTLRRGQRIAMKTIADEACATLPKVRHMIVVPRLGRDAPMTIGRDLWWDDLLSDQPSRFPTAELDAMHPLMVIYTSGTTGRPKGVVHTHCGFAVKMAMDTQLIWDLKATDRTVFMADFGWLAGPMALAAYTLSGGSFVMAEGTPDYPASDRLWRLVERHRGTFLGMAPTLARSLRRYGDEQITRHDLSSLRLISCSAEPIDSELWLWLFRTVGGGRIPLVNFSGGTEIGGIVFTDITRPIRPVTFHGGMPGAGADIVDEQGRATAVGELGELIMREPCIGRTHAFWQDEQRYIESYWQDIPGVWAHHDLASRDTNGSWLIHGRSDDTLKVSGKRTGPAEIEAILQATGLINDAAVVGVPDARSGSAVACVVIPAVSQIAGPALAKTLSDGIVSGMGSSFRPCSVLFVTDLPRTRNMKVMRRVVRAVLTGGSVGDLTALENPAAVEQLRRVAAGQSCA
jgi:acetyl-CoA synthetase